MTSPKQLESGILGLFAQSLRANRPDIADILLIALEKLDGEKAGERNEGRPLIAAYRLLIDFAAASSSDNTKYHH